MDPASPTAECNAGEQSIATGEVTFFGNTNGKAGKSDWLVWSPRPSRRHRQPSHGYGPLQ